MNFLRFLFESIFGPRTKPENNTGSWELSLLCADGLRETQGYDSEQEAEESGKRQTESDDFVVSYDVRFISLAQMIAEL